MVDADDADQRQVLTRGGFEFGDVEQERGVTGEQHDRTLAAVGDRGADGVGQAGAEVAEVLVPDHVVRLRLRVGPLEDHGGPAVAHHDAVLREGLGGLDDEAGGMNRSSARRRVLGELCQLLGVLLDQHVQIGRRLARSVLERLDQLRDDAAQVTHQRHVDRAVHADRRRILLDVDPLANVVALRPVPRLAVVHRLAQLGAQRDAQVAS